MGMLLGLLGMRCWRRKVLLIFAFLWLAPASAQVPMTGAGMAVPAVAAATYQGPGDVFSTSAIGFWSCARVWNAAAASTSTNLCDINAVTGGAAVCTLRGSSTGFVDLAGSYCAGTTPAAACAAASGGSCIISKVYNQVSPGTADLTQATAANMPPLVFSSTPSSTLPAISCGTAAQNLQVSSSSTITQSQPYTFSLVYRRTDATSSIAFGPSAGGVGIGGRASTANQAAVVFNTSIAVTGATDSTWHALSGLGNGGSGASNLNGTDASANAGTTALSAATLRFCRPNAGQFGGTIAEGILWGASTNSTNRGDINTNQHSAANGYNW